MASILKENLKKAKQALKNIDKEQVAKTLFRIVMATILAATGALFFYWLGIILLYLGIIPTIIFAVLIIVFYLMLKGLNF